MTEAKLARELKAISRELDEILAEEHRATAALDRRFTADHDAIEALLRAVQEARSDGRWRKTKFNIFDVLGRPRLEGAHSSFLAWLLNPGEAHGFGDRFLRKFMRTALGKEPPQTTDVALSPEKSIGDKRFDILVEGNGWRLVIENKVDDFPWKDQCDRYHAYCDELRARNVDAWLVYVTPARRPPGEVPWLSYRDVRLILEQLTPDDSAAMLIQHFCDHVVSDLEV
jgi:hypothetical protein